LPRAQLMAVAKRVKPEVVGQHFGIIGIKKRKTYDEYTLLFTRLGGIAARGALVGGSHLETVGLRIWSPT